MRGVHRRHDPSADRRQPPPVDCVEDGIDCGRADQCVTVLLWKKLNDAINGVVDNITLADLVDWQMQKDE